MSLYLANMWDGLFGKRGLELLGRAFGEVTGNWLSSPRQAPHPADGSFVLLAPSTMESAVTPAAAAEAASIVAGWVLFPDQVIGWDWQRQDYQYVLAPVLAETIAVACTVVANSAFTARNLRRAGVATELAVLPLGIDVAGIQAASAGADRSAPGVHVLWAHMWRSQKNPEAALRIATRVLECDPTVRITIGRSGSWLDEQHSPTDFRHRVTALADRLRRIGGDRVQFLDHFANQRDYWRMLSDVDISYSCSFEESFGVAMLEHAAAGAVCVCPNTLCYPETQQGAYLVPPGEAGIVAAIRELAADPVALSKVQAQCRAQAARHPVEATVRGIIELFDV